MEKTLILVTFIAAFTAAIGWKKVPKLESDDHTQLIKDMVSQITEDSGVNLDVAAEIAALKETVNQQNRKIAILQKYQESTESSLKQRIKIQENQISRMKKEIKDLQTFVVKQTKQFQETSEEHIVAIENSESDQDRDTDTMEKQMYKPETITIESWAKKGYAQPSTGKTATRNDITNLAARHLSDIFITNTEPDTHQVASKVQRGAVAVPFGKIAFSSYLGHNLVHITTGHTVKCDQVLSNYGGAYNSHTGVFTVTVTGVYLLTFHISTSQGQSHVRVKLVVDDREIVAASADPGPNSHVDMGGNTAIIPLTAGEAVWLEVFASQNGQLESSRTFKVVSFSGALLF